VVAVYDLKQIWVCFIQKGGYVTKIKKRLQKSYKKSYKVYPYLSMIIWIL